jgi:hypothetical protein
VKNSRQLVYETLGFENPSRVPRQLWELPWASMHHPEQLRRIKRDFPDDITVTPVGDGRTAEAFQTREADPHGDPFRVGRYVDVWGCTFENLQPGVVGEVKQPPVSADWTGLDELKAPELCLRVDRDAVNRYCKTTSTFVLAGDWARPFERMQFLRGTQQLYLDLMDRPPEFFVLRDLVHRFYCDLMEAWAETKVDALWLMDDWGAQNSLLVGLHTWQELFEPLYRDYVDIARKHRKRLFMHSDGYILDIVPHLIECGVDALNSQVFCMGATKLEAFRGRITFWGEIDRQHLLPHGKPEEIDRAVHHIRENMWERGGCIAQCEFGPGADPENVYRVFQAWNESGATQSQNEEKSHDT